MYKDYLVDKEIFIEWALAILHDADGSEVVIWMDFIKQFTVDIYQRRRWGRRLATSLCHQLQKVCFYILIALVLLLSQGLD